MPALLIIIIKDIYIILFHKGRKSLISACINTAAVLILLVQLLSAQKMCLSDILIFLAAESLWLPSMLTHFWLFRSECTEKSLSTLNDYPYFSQFAESGDRSTIYTFFNESIEDKFLIQALINTSSHNKVFKVLNSISLLCTGCAIVLTVFFSAALLQARHAKPYSEQNTYSYSYEPYVEVNLKSAAIGKPVLSDSDAAPEFWALPVECKKYVYLYGNKEMFNTAASAHYPYKLTGKIKKAQPGEISNLQLSPVLLNESCINTSDSQKKYLDSISRCDIMIEIINTNSIDSNLLNSLLITIISFAVYAFTGIFVSYKK